MWMSEAGYADPGSLPGFTLSMCSEKPQDVSETPQVPTPYRHPDHQEPTSEEERYDEMEWMTVAAGRRPRKVTLQNRFLSLQTDDQLDGADVTTGKKISECGEK